MELELDKNGIAFGTTFDDYKSRKKFITDFLCAMEQGKYNKAHL